ncbi:hypothetical protein MRX96_003531 [Rhipicephalus microplus]
MTSGQYKEGWLMRSRQVTYVALPPDGPTVRSGTRSDCGSTSMMPPGLPIRQSVRAAARKKAVGSTAVSTYPGASQRCHGNTVAAAKV